MTTAEKIAAGERQPTAAVKDAVEDVKAAAARVADGIKLARESGELRNRVHADEVMRRVTSAAHGGKDAPEADRKLLSLVEAGALTETNAKDHSGLTRAQTDERLAAVEEDWLAHGCYAYRFEKMDDGSVLAVYTLGPGKPVKYEAFADMSETASWHPTRAPRED